MGLLAIALAATLTACGGGSGGDGGGNSRAPTGGTQTSASPTPRAVVPNAAKSCTIIVGSGAIEDIATVFDKYKGNSNPFTTADAKAMRNALDRLAHAGDNASPKIREAVVKLVADAGSLIDSRARLEGVGKVASVQTIQEELGALCH
ncbi:MAG: hypothetical protein JWQ70_1695 [Aeromicrobium sp.]|nr:hypothetical protein [Aeromicrobium sp.]